MGWSPDGTRIYIANANGGDVHKLLGCEKPLCPTRNPDSAWVTQQARNIAAALEDQRTPVRFLIRDRDTKFTRPFDAVFEASGPTRIVCTPIRAPNANAHAERWVGSVPAECLDWTLIRGRRHLERVLRDYAEHFNGHRPHRGLGLRAPDRATITLRTAPAVHVKRTPILDGLINEYNAA
jgi:putative transposase